MKHRLVRLGLGAAIALVAAAPMTGAHASTCDANRFPEVCHAIYVACNATTVTYKVCSNIK
jgi:hypothetical protein